MFIACVRKLVARNTLWIACVFVGSSASIFSPTSALMAQTEWEFHGVVLPVGDPGAWDEQHAGRPHVVHDETNGGYRLFYVGYQGPSAPDVFGVTAIGSASSTALAGPWTGSDVPVLESPFGPETLKISNVEIVRDPGTGTYRAYVSSFCGAACSEVLLATSNDLDRWDWSSFDPIFAAELPWEGGFGNGQVGLPSIVLRGEEYHMWYQGASSSFNAADPVSLGYARSANGFDWVRRAEPLPPPGRARALVRVLWHEDSQSWEMFHDVFSGSTTLGRSTSLDGLEWYQDDFLLGPPEGDRFTSVSVRYEADPGEYHLWVAPSSETGVWYATSPWTQPRAAFSVTPELEVDPQDWILTSAFGRELTFDATRSTTPAEGGITTYAWDFGDGTEASGAQVTHVYTFPGEYPIVLGVTDAAGNTGRVARRVRLSSSAEALAPWLSDDVGHVSSGGGVVVDGDCMTVSVANGDSLDGSDHFYFVHRPATGDFVLEADIEAPEGASRSGRVGLMARESLDADTPDIFLWVSGDGTVRSSEHGEVGRFSEVSSVQLRLERIGNAFLASYRPRGEAQWSEPAEWVPDADAPLSNLLEVGVATYNRKFNTRSLRRVCGLTLTRALFRRGEINGDGRRDLSDGIALLGFLFLGEPPPACGKSADTNDSGGLDLSDASYLFNHLFLGDPAPPPPFSDCGVDPTPDPIACAGGDPACR